MHSHKCDRSEFIAVCAAVTSGLMGKRAEIEVISPIDGILIKARWLPVVGITYDPVQDTLRIVLDGLEHLVFQPRELHLDFGVGGFRSLGILDERCVWQIVSLRDPLMLPHPAVGLHA